MKNAQSAKTQTASPQAIKDLIDKLTSMFSWWQVKYCTRGGKKVYLISIQHPNRSDWYHNGQDENLATAITKAMKAVKEDKEPVKE